MSSGIAEFEMGLANARSDVLDTIGKHFGGGMVRKVLSVVADAYHCDMCGGELRIGCVPGSDLDHDFCHGNPEVHKQKWTAGWAWKQGQNDSRNEAFFNRMADDPFGDGQRDPEIEEANASGS